MNNSSLIRLKVTALNVNSIIKISRRHNLNEFLREHRPDFLLISETKLKNKHKVLFSKYETFRNDRQSDAGGGTAVICKNIFKTEQIACDPNIKSFEYTMVKVYLSNNKYLFIIAIYKPPSVQLNSDELNSLISKCGQSQIIIGGDFNAKHRAWANEINDINGKQLYTWLNQPPMNEKMYMLTGKESTCNRSNNSYIDLIVFSKSIINAYKTNTHNQLAVINYLSDHNAILFECAIADKILEKEPLYKFSYKNVNWEKINKKN